jgi:ribosomal protein S18 acetylase RimI-like enzyme
MWECMGITIRRLQKKDEKKVFSLIKRTFLKYNNISLSQEVIRDYLSFLTHDNFCVFLRQDSFVAEYDRKVVGFARGRRERISSLFVDGRYHRRSIGTRLTAMLEAALMKNTDIIRIRSSLHAVDFYERVGYRKTTGVRRFHGILMQPMKKVVRKH